MATEAGELIIKIGADVEEMKNALKDMSERMTATGTKSVAMGNLIADALKKMAKAALDFAIDSIKAFGENEVAVLRLSAAVGDKAAGALSAYAIELQKTTIYTDEAVMAMQTQLANFGLMPGSIMDATDAIIRFASSTGKDLPEATNTFTQALGGNSRELKRMGLQILETDDRATRMAKTVSFMTEQFHLTGEEIKDTTLGSIENLKNRFDELTERIGKMLAPSLAKLIGYLNTVVGWFEKLTGAAYDNASAVDKQVMVLERHQGMIKLAIQGHVDYRHQLEMELGVHDLTDEALRKLMVSHTQEIKLLKQKSTAEKAAAREGKKGIEEVQTAAEESVEARVSGLKKELDVVQATYARIDEVTSLSTQKKLADSELEVTQMMADSQQLTAFTALETQKRILQSQNSFEANASFSEQLKVKLIEDSGQVTANFVNMATTAVNSFSSGVADMIMEGKRFSDVMKEVWKNLAHAIIEQIAQMIAKWLIFQAMTGGAGGGFGRLIGGMASGGMINEPSILTGMRSGTSHFVGESGPEMVVPVGASGNKSFAQTPSMGGGGGGTIVVNINGTLLEGNAAKWQKIVREAVVPEIRRWSMSSPVGPFNRRRGSAGV